MAGGDAGIQCPFMIGTAVNAAAPSIPAEIAALMDERKRNLLGRERNTRGPLCVLRATHWRFKTIQRVASGKNCRHPLEVNARGVSRSLQRFRTGLSSFYRKTQTESPPAFVVTGQQIQQNCAVLRTVLMAGLKWNTRNGSSGRFPTTGHGGEGGGETRPFCSARRNTETLC